MLKATELIYNLNLYFFGTEVDFNVNQKINTILFLKTKLCESEMLFHIMNKNKRENKWATSLRLLRDCFLFKTKAFRMFASCKIAHSKKQSAS